MATAMRTVAVPAEEPVGREAVDESIAARYVVLDLETNPDRADPAEHEIIEVGAVRVGGWSLALDMDVGGWHGDVFGWLERNAHRYGWHRPGWVRIDGSKPEPCRWEFGG